MKVKKRRVLNTQIIQKTFTVEYISLQTVFILIYMFLSLNCNMNEHHRNYFSVDIAFYNYYVTM